jgi:hypothetical protein
VAAVVVVLVDAASVAIAGHVTRVNIKNNHCKNMNHGKMNPMVRFCPQCGDRFQTKAAGSCNEEKHAARRKERNIFCYDCGKKLTS